MSGRLLARRETSAKSTLGSPKTCRRSPRLRSLTSPFREVCRSRRPGEAVPRANFPSGPSPKPITNLPPGTTICRAVGDLHEKLHIIAESLPGDNRNRLWSDRERALDFFIDFETEPGASPPRNPSTGLKVSRTSTLVDPGDRMNLEDMAGVIGFHGQGVAPPAPVFASPVLRPDPPHAGDLQGFARAFGAVDEVDRLLRGSSIRDLGNDREGRSRGPGPPCGNHHRTWGAMGFCLALSTVKVALMPTLSLYLLDEGLVDLDLDFLGREHGIDVQVDGRRLPREVRTATENAHRAGRARSSPAPVAALGDVFS